MSKYHDYPTIQDLAENSSREDTIVVLPSTSGWISVKARDPKTTEIARYTVDLKQVVRQLVERQLEQVVKDLRNAGVNFEVKEWVDSPTIE